MRKEVATRSSVGKAIALGAAWTLSVQFVVRSIGVVSTLILARLLTPADFGVYGLAMSVYAFVELIRAFGFGAALIQNRQATDAHYNTAWTMHFLFSLVSALLLYFSAPYAAEFLNEAKLEPVVQFLCLLFLVDGLKNIGLVNFQKHMTFHKEFRLNVIVKLCGFFVTIPLAFLLKSYWAMLWGLLISSAVLVALSYVMQPYRPWFTLSHWRELMSFTMWLQLNNFLSYFNRNIENFLVSRVLGVAAVGSLRLAKESGNLLGEITQPINRVSYPGYAKVNNDPAKVMEVFQDVMGIMMVAGFMVAIGIFAIAHLMVPTLLGSKWLDIIPLVKGFAAITLIRVWIGNTNNVLVALGRQKLATVVVAIRLLVFVILLNFLLPEFGLIGVVYASFIAMSTVSLVSFSLLRANIKLPLRTVLYILAKPALASVVMFMVIQLLFPVHWADSSFIVQLVQLILSVICGASVYILVLGLLWLLESRPEGPETNLLRIIDKRVGFVGFLLPRKNGGA